MMLGAGFATFSVQSEHPYQVASLLQLDLLDTRLDAGARVCSLKESPRFERTKQLVESWCKNSTLVSAEVLELRGMWSNCGLILDDRPWDIRHDMSKCTREWVKHIFSTQGIKKMPGGIGIHIRWGDMADGTFINDPKTPARSTPIEKASQLLRKLRECGVGDELSVYMESHNDTMLHGLGEPYRIVDTGNDVDDLVDLASNRVIILDVGSYTELAHQIAEGGITIVPDQDMLEIAWHDNIGVNHLLRWHELLAITCSDLSDIFNNS